MEIFRSNRKISKNLVRKKGSQKMFDSRSSPFPTFFRVKMHLKFEHPERKRKKKKSVKNNLKKSC